jgi:hypothetical protein
MLFFEKKNQKTFITLARAGGKARAKTNKSLLLLFFRKEVLASFRIGASAC